ncbi:proline-rich protein 18 [Pteronotus mesoamericanus]|uniref:proline-rich protein 18 n=1 Tax=Pteronotus mesoamericanus TaxID=1884717 RepID=UPI0023EDC1A5|nr:proline-rich protein 18 [Pteronotus parnellii mesoamericanus]
MLRRLGGAMPFPLPPPAPAPGIPATRPPPRRTRKAAAPTCAPPAPSPPAAAAGEKQRPSARPEALLPRSWPSATLRKPPARRAPGPAAPRPLLAGSGASPARTTGTAASRPGRDAAVRLPPEAALVLQQPLLARPRRPLPTPSANARRLLGPGPRAKAAGLRREGDPGGPDARPPGAPLLPRGPRAPEFGPRPAHLRRVLKVSLLNDQHKYDDVEYEEETLAVDEALVRRCTEWLRGVESAAAARDRTRPLDALTHLSTL